MILDFRYHIFTIAAIFVALGLGILIGSSMVGDKTLVDQQQRLIENIGEKVNKLNDKNNSLKAKIGEYKTEIVAKEEVISQLLSLGFKDSLADQEYILLEGNQSDFKQDRAKEIFKITGAKLQIKADLSSQAISGNDQILFPGEEANLKKYQEYIDRIPASKIVKIKSDDLAKTIISLIERKLDERKKSNSNHTGL